MAKSFSFFETAKNVLVLAVTCLITVVLADLGLQYFLKIPPRYLKKIVYFDPVKIPPKRLRPNVHFTAVNDFREFAFQVTLDAHGFRKSPKIPNADPREAILFVGDSQAFGIGPNDDQTFIYLTGVALNRPVINTAVPGANNIEEWLMAKSVLSEIPKPRTLILCFSNGTDPYENYQSRKKFEGADQPLASAQVAGRKNFKATNLPTLARFKDFLVRRSALYQLLIRLRRYPAINRLFHRMGLVEPGVPSELNTFASQDTPVKQAYWEITDKVLLKLRQLCLERGIHLMILIIPDRYQVDGAYWNAWVKKYNLRPQDFDMDAPNKHLRAFCDLQHVFLIDPTPALRENYQKGNSGYWKMDLHLSPVGHAIIRDVLVRQLKNEPASL